MSTETSELNQPNDGDSSEPHRRFGFLHADTGVDSGGVDKDGVDEDGVDRDVLDTDVDDEDEDEDDTSLTGSTAVYDSADDPDVVDEDVVDPQPTFTPVGSEEPTTTLPDGQVVEGEVVEEEVVDDDVTSPDGQYEPSTLDGTSTVPASVTEAVPASDAVPASAVPAPRAVPFDENAPLLGDSVTLKASWQQAAAEFVDDPRAAVAEAAELVEHTAQTLVGALQQRQRQLRGQWENGTETDVAGSDGTTDQASGTADTEELRHLMQSYRALFNQLTSL